MMNSTFKPRIRPVASLLRTANLPEPPTPKLAAKPKTRKCKVCKQAFRQDRPLQAVCSPACGLEVAKIKKQQAQIKQQKKEREELKARKEAIKSRSQWLADAQDAVNKFIRARDEKLPCISCGNTREKSKYNAGHYLSRGAHPALRFHEDNIHKQCEHCNTHLAGNALNYRIALIAKIGIDRIQWLEGPHAPNKYSIDDAKAIKAAYKAKLKELLASRE